MAEVQRAFLPWGAFTPDAGEFGHDNLTRLDNLLPAFGNYLPMPRLKLGAGTADQDLLGFFVHRIDNNSYRQYAGSETKLWEVSNDGVTFTDRTRAVGGAYNAWRIWAFCGFGDLVVATEYNSAVQGRSSSSAKASGAFSDLITSTFKPRAKFAFPVRGNLFLANCNLPSTYDTLSSGANPYLYCWSATDAPASFGSANVDPQLVGAGFQQITNDMGEIVGGVGGDYGLIFQERGIVRIDGPPYAYRTIADGYTTKFHYSIVKVDEDVYFWGTGGPAVLRGGDGPAEWIGQGAIERSVVDQFSGFAEQANLMNSYLTSNHSTGGITGAYAPTISTIVWTARTDSNEEQMAVAYNTRERRFSFLHPVGPDASLAAYFLCARPALGASAQKFNPVEELVAVGGPALTPTNLATWDYGQSLAALPLRFGRGFVQLDPDRVTRVLRMRPVHRLSPDASALTLTVTVDDVGAPSGTPVTATAGPPDAEGWCAFDSTLETAFHRPRVTYQFADDASPNLMECQGVEIEYLPGAVYGA